MAATQRRAHGRSVPPWIPTTSLALSLVAVSLTTYLTVTHYVDPAALACPDTGALLARKDTGGHADEANLGLAWALGMTALNLPRAWRSTAPWMDTLRLVGASAGGLTVLYLVYVELFRVGAICLWCTGVHLTALALLTVTLVARPLLSRGRAVGAP